MKLSIFFDRLRWEEKTLADEARAAGLSVDLVDTRSLHFDISRTPRTRQFGDGILQRCISHYRALFSTRILESAGAKVINSYIVAETCGNKLATTMALARAGVPTPKTVVALSSESVESASKRVRFPLVMKPFTGSWGRMVSVAKDRDTLTSLVELREEIHNPLEHMYYLQEFVRRPPRDIRAIVAGDEVAACVYRRARRGDWRTNVARGGTTRAFKPSPSLVETVLKSAEAVGGGVLGIDAMESDSGPVVHEVNNVVEFRGAQAATEGSIAAKIIGFATRSLRR